MLALATERLRLHVATWARRRQGTDSKSIVLKKRRVYILPSHFGLIFAILVFAMVLGAMNYASSLGFALAFLLTGLGIVTMHHCHRNLLGTHIRFPGVQPVFAGENCEYRLALTNNSRATRYEISLHHDANHSHAQDLEPRETKSISLKVPTQARGRKKLSRCSIATRFPGNLFRAWSWIHMDAACIVYPKPVVRGRPLPMSSGGDGSHGVAERGDADFAGLKTAEPADPPQRIAWKAYARSNELLTKQFTGGEQRAQILAWDQLHGLETEERLSQLTRWCLDAATEECAFGLVLPGTAIPLGSGQRHLHDCLKALALFGGAGEL